MSGGGSCGGPRGEDDLAAASKEVDDGGEGERDVTRLNWRLASLRYMASTVHGSDVPRRSEPRVPPAQLIELSEEAYERLTALADGEKEEEGEDEVLPPS